MSIARKSKKRKHKLSKAQTYNARRQANRARRARRRAHTERRKRERRQFKFRVKMVRYYYKKRRAQMSEKEAVKRTPARWQPRKPGHFPLSASRIRQWYRIAEREGIAAWRPKSKRPHHTTFMDCMDDGK